MVKENNIQPSQELSRAIIKVYNQETVSWMEMQRGFSKVEIGG